MCIQNFCFKSSIFAYKQLSSGTCKIGCKKTWFTVTVSITIHFYVNLNSKNFKVCFLVSICKCCFYDSNRVVVLFLSWLGSKFLNSRD